MGLRPHLFHATKPVGRGAYIGVNPGIFYTHLFSDKTWTTYPHHHKCQSFDGSVKVNICQSKSVSLDYTFCREWGANEKAIVFSILVPFSCLNS